MLYIISLEPLETRYTRQWKDWFGQEFPNAIFINGNTVSELSNSKNFLDPIQTNMWKSEQIIKISELFKQGVIRKEDKFLFLDAWHYGIVALKYISELFNIPIKMYGLWHAGSYDPWDLLGSTGLFKYFSDFELSLFKCLDKSFVATRYHKDLIVDSYPSVEDKIYVTGFPYRFDQLPSIDVEKENLIIFPHRLSGEKQPGILKEIEPELNKLGIHCIFCQEKKLNKGEYHTLLAKSKIVFSASLQETWGLGIFEGLYYKAIPLVPNRLSYVEMYDNNYKYPSYWTYPNFHAFKEDMIKKIIHHIRNYDNLLLKREDNIEYLKNSYCTFKNIKKEIEND